MKTTFTTRIGASAPSYGFRNAGSMGRWFSIPAARRRTLQLAVWRRHADGEGSTLGAAWYGQGLRLLDISDARDVRQVGYYRVTGTTPSEGENPSSNSWDLAFTQKRRREYAYLFDMSRGVEVLRIRGSTARSARMKSVTAPSVKADRFASRPVSSLVRTSSAANGGASFVCPLFS